MKAQSARHPTGLGSGDWVGSLGPAHRAEKSAPSQELYRSLTQGRAIITLAFVLSSPKDNFFSLLLEKE